MSPSATQFYAERPCLQGPSSTTTTTLSSSSSLSLSPPSPLALDLDHRARRGHCDHHHRSSSPLTFSSPAPPSLISSSSSSSSAASTPTTVAMSASPVTVYSDRLQQQAEAGSSSAPVSGRGHSHSHSQSIIPHAPAAPHVPPIEFVRAHAKGTVRFAPYETGLDAAALAAIDEFQVYPFGAITEYCRHIPYASGKKDFYEKTGREGFEVFQYVFKIPGGDGGDSNDKEYHVMWDYNVGLVRMTPFFKCCKYSKTTPAKMLGLNPGLREITHSITGGSIMAQGYWMPFACAKAVCATFCYHIAGALVPIFGPGFPAECLPPQSTGYGRMVIDRRLVHDATRDTEMMRQLTLKDAKAAGRAAPRPTADRYYLVRQPAWPLAYDQPPPLQIQMHHHRYERGPELAPIKYYCSSSSPPASRGPAPPLLLPSPVERETLPPFSHVASLTLAHYDDDEDDAYANGAITLPPLVIRDHHHHHHHQQQQHAGYHGYAADTMYPAAAPYEDDMNAYDDYHRSSHCPPDASRQTRWMARASLGSPPTDYPAPPPPPQSQYWTEAHGGAEDGEEDDAEDAEEVAAYFAPSSCYPSPPPRLPPLVSGEDETAAAVAVTTAAATAVSYTRPPLGHPGRHHHGEDKTRTRSTGHRKSASSSSSAPSSQPQHRRHHRHQRSTSARRTTTTTMTTTTPAARTAWNTRDADAAELLVHLRDDSQGGEGSSSGNSSTTTKTGRPPPPPPLQPPHHSTGQRFAASISSLLCDDPMPRKRRRGV